MTDDMATAATITRRRGDDLPGDVDALFDRLERAIIRRRKPAAPADNPRRS
jgi:hypothetical protein